MEKTKQDVSYTAAGDPKAQRNPGQMSLSHTNTKSHTHTPISQVHTDETPTASHSVMTHAIIAFPPVVKITPGIAEFIVITQLLKDWTSQA